MQQSNGHNDPNFNPTMSYFWGIPLLIHRIDTQGGVAQAYKCGIYSRECLITGARRYNGGSSGAGDPQYEQKLRQALMGQIGCSLP
jgi:hypothetical protein